MSGIAVFEGFCGAGLATRGLERAGAREIYGVDIRPQRRWRGYKFLHADMTSVRERPWLLSLARECDFVWLSPPCQFATSLRHAPNARPHANLIPNAREFLRESGKPGVIENVEGAREHLEDPICLCGTMFGLGAKIDGKWFNLERHRYFECHGFTPKQMKCKHDGPAIGIYGAHARVRAASAGGRGTAWPFKTSQLDAAAQALGVEGEGLTLGDMSQGIPPAYARHLLNVWCRQSKGRT